jgi:peroxiredoxin
LLYAGACFAQLNGKEIIKHSADSLKKLKSARYHIYSEEYGNTITADIIVNRKKEYPVFGVAQIKVTGVAVNDEGSSQISWTSNGKSFEFFDNKKNAIVRIDSPNNQKIFRAIISTVLLPPAPYLEKEPFENIIRQAKSYELLKDTVVNHISCWAVKLNNEFVNDVLGKVRSTATWYIGKKDFLVYGVEYDKVRKFLKITELNNEYEDSVFRLSSYPNIEKVTGLEPVSEGLLPIGTIAPDWTLPSPSLGKITLSDLKGKVVLLDFWGTWCVPCIRSMPEIQAIHDHFKGELVEIIGVSVEMEKAADPVAFIKKKGYTYSIVLDGHKIAGAYKVIQFPSVYIIDKSGKIIYAEHSINRSNFKEDIIAKIKTAIAE